MSLAVNLIPLPTLKQLQGRRLMVRWSVIWLVGVVSFVVCFLFMRHTIQHAEATLTAANDQTSGIRQAQSQTRALLVESQKLKQSVEFAQGLEQSDTPLTLLQTVAACCQQVQPAARLLSLRLSESTTVASSPSKNNHTNKHNSVTRKHLELSGVAQADACLNLVSALRATGVFHNVELMNSQSTSERQLSEQSFQIRCEQ